MNIELRTIAFEDIELIRSWRNSDLIKNVSYSRGFISSEMQIKWYNGIKDDLSQLHWIINIDKIDVGYAAIKNIDLLNKRCEFSSLYIADENFLLNGSGAIVQYKVLDYVFETYPDITKVFCEVLGFNKKVIQLHKRFGFIIEGEQKNHYLLDGKFENVILLSLFRDKWELTRPVLKNILMR
jgi:UDP-4-amino-4,6-dideoxy-N-acetyl-beta-L-altrosamine N-acetyltransferase